MWKAAAGTQLNIKPEPAEDDDWDTDPDFINDVTEEQQRWGSTTIQGSGRTAGAIDMAKLRQETEDADKKKKQQELLTGPNASYGYGGKFGVQKDRMDQSAVGHDYIAKVEKHVSQKDYATGFGGKYGVQTDRVDKSAVSWDHKEKVEKHTSQKDYTTGFGGKFGVQKDRQDKSAVGWDHIEKVAKHESQKDYVQGFGGKFGVQKDRQDKSALGWDHHEASQKHESQTDHKIGFGGKFGIQTDRMDKSALTFDEESAKVGTTYTKVKPDIGTAKPSDLRAKFERMASEDNKTSTVQSSPAPRGSVQSKAAIFTNKEEEKVQIAQEKVPKLDQSKMAFLTQDNETETIADKIAPAQLDKTKIECFTSTATDTNVMRKVIESSNLGQEQSYVKMSSQLEEQEHSFVSRASQLEEHKQSYVNMSSQMEEHEQCYVKRSSQMEEYEQSDVKGSKQLQEHEQSDVKRSSQLEKHVLSTDLETSEDKSGLNIETTQASSPTALVEDYTPEEEIVDTGLSAVALYDYLASAEDEISFDPGDLITHIEMIDQGWWRGMCKGNYGLFPANYVQLQE